MTMTQTSFDNVPFALARLTRWIYWKWDQKDGKRIKRPCYLEDGEVKYKGYAHPSAWTSFEEAKENFDDKLFAGLGFHFKGADVKDKIVAIDLDHCFEDGILTDQALAIIHEMDSYTEKSPSGNGIRIIVEGEWPSIKCKDTSVNHVEVFHKSGFVTITGDHLSSSPEAVSRKPRALQWLAASFFPDKVLKDHGIRNHENDPVAIRQIAEECVEAIIEGRPHLAEDYSTWVSVGMALHWCSDDLFPTFDKFSQVSTKYDEHITKTKWSSFSRDGLVTIGTLIHYARETGWEPPEGSPLRDSCKGVDPLDAAEDLMEKWSEEGRPCVRYYKGGYVSYSNGVYSLIGADIKQEIWLKLAMTYKDINPTFVNSVDQILRGLVKLEPWVEAPRWLNSDVPNPAECVCTPTRIIHLPTGVEKEHTPRYFSFSQIAADYDRDNTECPGWLRFLDGLWGDQEGGGGVYIRLLQQWMGYCLVPDTSLQKMLLFVGPPRSGKGTIVRILERILGKSNVAGLQLGQLDQTFGVQGLLGKSLAVFGDMRVPRNLDKSGALQTLLSITGEDSIPVQRKFMSTVDIRLPIKLMALTNELPRLPDESGAMATRYSILETFKSFEGEEDRGLEDRLIQELPGILAWAIEGYRDLKSGSGELPVPSTTEICKEALKEASGAFQTFVEDCLTTGVNQRASNSDLWAVYQAYCTESGNHPVSRNGFYLKLRNAVPGLSRVKSYSKAANGSVRAYEGVAIPDNIRERYYVPNGENQ